MKALLLAAGRGTRISRYLEGNPKCTVDIGGEKLIQYTIKLLKQKEINDIGMVLGYRSSVIKETLKDYDIKYYYNPFFDVTNSIASSWFAKDFLDDDILIMNADVYLEEKLLDHILENKDEAVMFADSSRKEEADYKFKFKNGVLLKYGKELKGEDISGEYIGIGKFNKNFMRSFNAQLQTMIDNQEHSYWWENVVYAISEQRDIKVDDVIGRFWAEVDYIEDYERILKYRGVSFNNTL